MTYGRDWKWRVCDCDGYGLMPHSVTPPHKVHHQNLNTPKYLQFIEYYVLAFLRECSILYSIAVLDEIMTNAVLYWTTFERLFRTSWIKNIIVTPVATNSRWATVVIPVSFQVLPFVQKMSHDDCWKKNFEIDPQFHSTNGFQWGFFLDLSGSIPWGWIAGGAPQLNQGGGKKWHISCFYMTPRGCLL